MLIFSHEDRISDDLKKFRDFVKVFTDFAQISTDFARILNFWGCAYTTANKNVSNACDVSNTCDETRFKILCFLDNCWVA